MAVTSLWRIHGRIDTVLRYAENPDKTEMSAEDLNDVLLYAMNDRKTSHIADESEALVRQLVSGLQCTPETACSEMRVVQLRFDKTDGVVAYHGYQSFAPGEATPEVVHEIGIKLANELWGARHQVLVATHLDKANHLHNHFVINTVSYIDGKKFHRTRQDYLAMQQVSDRLCQEYGLSTIQDPSSKRKKYNEYMAEKNGDQTIRSSIRADIDRAIAASNTEQQFLAALKKLGYAFNFYRKDGGLLERPGIKPPGATHFFSFHRLGGERYEYEQILMRILNKTTREEPHPATELVVAKHRESQLPALLIGTSGLHRLYIRWLFELRIIQKYPTAKRVSMQMRDDLRKLDRIDEEVRFLAKTGITDLTGLQSFLAEAEADLRELSQLREEARKELRAAARKDDVDAANATKHQLDRLTSALREKRHEMKLAEDIAQKTEQRKQALEQFNEQDQIPEKGEKKYELLK